MIQTSHFTPFGEFTQVTSGGSTNHLTEYLFTDQENDPESGLMYYGARYYDPWVGRFLSQDPGLIGDEAGVTFDRIGFDAQNFNAYSYVLNRPTVLVDPNGEDAEWFTVNITGGEVGGGQRTIFGRARDDKKNLAKISPSGQPIGPLRAASHT